MAHSACMRQSQDNRGESCIIPPLCHGLPLPQGGLRVHDGDRDRAQQGQGLQLRGAGRRVLRGQPWARDPRAAGQAGQVSGACVCVCVSACLFF